MRPSAVYKPSRQARYRVCQCELAAVFRRHREQQTFLGAETWLTSGLSLVTGLHELHVPVSECN